MSMIGNLLLISAQQLAALEADPASVHDLVHPDDDEELVNHLDIDKAWHVIHFLLNGTAWDGEHPLNFLVSGGEPLGDEDVGYGPARAFRPEQVSDIVAALGAISPDELRNRFEPGALHAAEIYPQIWDRALEPDEAEYFIGHFETMLSLLRDGAARGEGLLVWLD